MAEKTSSALSNESIRLALCDDATDIWGVVDGALVSAFRKHQLNAVVENFKNAKSLENRMKETDFDLIFLDIDMPGMDGITFAKRLRAGNYRTDIIFISSREDKVFDALKTDPRGFIRKSRFLEDVSEYVNLWIKQRPDESRARLMIEKHGETMTVMLDKVLYIEGEGKSQQIHLAEEDPIEITESMQELEEALYEKGFIRIHRGYLVNFRYIRRFDSAEAVLTNGERLPLSRRRVQDIRDRYLDLMKDSGNVIF